MFRTRSIALKLILSIVSATTVIFACIFWYNYRVSRELIERHAEENAGNIALAAAGRVQTVLGRVETLGRTTARFVETGNLDHDALERLLRDMVGGNGEAYGMGVSFAPFALDPGRRLNAPYVYRKGGAHEGLATLSLDEAYDYTQQEWYTAAEAARAPVWSEPYFDKGAGNALMTTYSVPIYRGDGPAQRLFAIVTVDVALDWLERIVSPLRVFQNGYGFLLSHRGTFLTHPLPALVMKQTIFDVATARGDQNLMGIGRRMVAGERGFVLHRSVLTGKDGFVFFMPLEPTRWSIGIVCPEDELFADVYRLNKVMFTLGFAGFAILLGVIVLIAGSITRPLRTLAEAASNIGLGQLDRGVPVITSRDEVGDLAGVLTQMVASLRQYVKNLTETTAAKERIESELKIAHDIQLGSLPTSFPTRPELELHAVLTPAREVGGDLYDFFWSGERTLCFAVGDVSDKGVAAALFMATTKTLHKIVALANDDPSEVMAETNRTLAAENRADMFVTLFSARLDVETGEVRYCNAGHNPPLRLAPDGQVSALGAATGPAAGIFEDARYGEERLLLAPGEALVLFTDGVTEARDPAGAMYGDDRLEALVGRGVGLSAQALTTAIEHDVVSFAAGAAPADDVTILVLRYLGGKSAARTETLSLDARIESLPQLEPFCARCAERLGLSPSVGADLRLALDELVTNTICYGYEDQAPHQIEIAVARLADELRITLEDDGRPFDPLGVAAPDTTQPLEERATGGLGLHLVKKVMDDVAYERRGTRNVIRLRKRLGGTGPA